MQETLENCKALSRANTELQFGSVLDSNVDRMGDWNARFKVVTTKNLTQITSLIT
jgi:hypothetical protein